MKDENPYDYDDFDWLKELAMKHCKSPSSRFQVDCMELHYCGYSEPGYQNEGDIAVTGNWNKVTKYDPLRRKYSDVCDVPAKLGKIFEALDIECEWEDEWTTCSECHGLVRTSPDSYSWKQSYAAYDDELLCHKCIAENAEDFLEELEGDADRVNTMDLDLEEAGYVEVVDRFQSGLYGGQASSPRLIARLLSEAGFSRYLFNLDYVRQFDLDFSVWLHKDEAENGGLEKAKLALRTGKTDGEDPAAVMRRGLQEASRQQKEIREKGGVGDGTVHQKIIGDKVETHVVSPDDFVKGKMP